jgi:hypothetical protein
MYKEGSTIKAISKVGNILDRRPLLHLKNFNTNLLIGKSPEDILNILFIKQKYTYTLEEHGIFQCGINRKRSQGDMYRIMKYYHPTITFYEFRQLILSLINNKKLSSAFCSLINKRTFFKPSQDWTCIAGDIDMFYTNIDEFKLKFIRC